MPLLTPEIRKFIAANAGVSPAELALRAGKVRDLPMAFVAQQVKGRAKAKAKLPRWFANERVVFPKSLSLEQCSSEAAARYKASLVAGDTAIDLTGGYGVDTTFLAERFRRTVYVEREEELREIVNENVAAFGLEEKVECVLGDGLEWLRASGERFDLVYADPARRDERSLKVSAFEECEPNVIERWDELLACGETVMVKASPGMDVTRGLEQLGGVFEAHAVSVGNECKELLFLARKGFEGEARIHCVNIGVDGRREIFDFLFSEERGLEGSYGPVGRYLYEPNASVMKGGGFKVFSERLGLPLLHPRTRYLSGDHLLDNFSGRVFEILDTTSVNAKEAKKLFPERKANVMARNCGMGAEELKRKLKFRDGGEWFAVGTTNCEGKRVLLKARRVS